MFDIAGKNMGQQKKGPAEYAAIQIQMADLESSIFALKRDDKSIAADGKGAVRLIVPDKPANFWILGVKKLKVEEVEILEPRHKCGPQRR